MNKKSATDLVIIRKRNHFFAGTFYAPREIQYISNVAAIDRAGEDDVSDTIEDAEVMTRAEAEKLCKELKSGIYHERNGECGRPTYTIIKAPARLIEGR